MRFLPMQPGGMPDRESDESTSAHAVGYPMVSIEEGVARFAQWYLEYIDHRETLPHCTANRSARSESMLT
ncbi:hypothetical protein WCE37_10500 [Luteimonas sp. MJ250]|uniref:hypothetical protein n=1 Tax=Luteimonas sp. MJ250 TaxID=3129236 RepID=UPI0031BB95FB